MNVHIFLRRRYRRRYRGPPATAATQHTRQPQQSAAAHRPESQLKNWLNRIRAAETPFLLRTRPAPVIHPGVRLAAWALLRGQGGCALPKQSPRMAAPVPHKPSEALFLYVVYCFLCLLLIIVIIMFISIFILIFILSFVFIFSHCVRAATQPPPVAPAAAAGRNRMPAERSCV